MPRLACAGLLAASLAPAAGFGQTVENRDVYVLADNLADEVELVREHMGRRYDDTPPLPVVEASEYEVYFQAQTLFRKSNRLAHEIAGAEILDVPPPPDRPTTASDVYALVSGALEQIRIVKDELGIEERVEPRMRNADISPTGNFLLIVAISRQLNLMMADVIRSSDVYDAVDAAIAHAAAILRSRGISPIVPAWRFEGPKQPIDGYRRLLECIDIVSRAAPELGVQVLGMSPRRNLPDEVAPAHVYDIANILVADLSLLARQLGAGPVDVDLGPRPEHIFPAQVHQRAGVLRAQLRALEASL